MMCSLCPYCLPSTLHNNLVVRIRKRIDIKTFKIDIMYCCRDDAHYCSPFCRLCGTCLETIQLERVIQLEPSNWRGLQEWGYESQSDQCRFSTGMYMNQEHGASTIPEPSCKWSSWHMMFSSAKLDKKRNMAPCQMCLSYGNFNPQKQV